MVMFTELILAIVYYIIIPLIITSLILPKIKTKRKHLVGIGILALTMLVMVGIGFVIWALIENFADFYNPTFWTRLAQLFGRAIIGMYGIGLIIYSVVGFVVDIILLMIIIKIKFKKE